MSRIGIKPIKIESGVNVTVERGEVTATGPMGTLRFKLPHGISVTTKDDQLWISRAGETKLYRSLHGTTRAVIQNMVTGVLKGFEKKLEMVGIGYRGTVEGNIVNLSVGFTHPVKLTIPEGVTAKIEKNIITVNGRDKQVVGQFAAIIRGTKKPEPYKGKGIRYQGEIVRMKQGKAVKAGA